MAYSLWGSKEVEWTASNSEGASGGMGRSVNLVNIYAPCSVNLRRELWQRLIDRRTNSLNEEWCLGGDFNEVTSSDERLGEGLNHNRKGMEEFRDFMVRMGVVDLPCVGGRFSWFKDNGKAMSRLDRFLLTNNLIDAWGVIDQRIGIRDVSDHAPIRLFCGEVDWGPKPFKFNNAWLKHGKFKEFICNEWATLKIEGRGDFMLFEKLKKLKNRILAWNREVFGWIVSYPKIYPFLFSVKFIKGIKN
ncbi:uncharacterized protein LOC131659440 [Vicia villosa]|uniref:uncharacterized protein LOC131659440 n=1 Tax=Vicia villosa TaxID=3911 RepID=UPI00273BBEDC|nr:uncharacterized protein LOC131659440 [Vicia villosa]